MPREQFNPVGPSHYLGSPHLSLSDLHGRPWHSSRRAGTWTAERLGSSSTNSFRGTPLDIQTVSQRSFATGKLTLYGPRVLLSLIYFSARSAGSPWALSSQPTGAPLHPQATGFNAGVKAFKPTSSFGASFRGTPSNSTARFDNTCT
jgi:hypothetical protein